MPPCRRVGAPAGLDSASCAAARASRGPPPQRPPFPTASTLPRQPRVRTDIGSVRHSTRAASRLPRPRSAGRTWSGLLSGPMKMRRRIMRFFVTKAHLPPDTTSQARLPILLDHTRLVTRANPQIPVHPCAGEILWRSPLQTVSEGEVGRPASYPRRQMSAHGCPSVGTPRKNAGSQSPGVFVFCSA